MRDSEEEEKGKNFRGKTFLCSCGNICFEPLMFENC